MKFRLSTLVLLALISANPLHATVTGDITIKPSAPNNTTWSAVLPVNVSAELTITVATEEGYEIKGTPAADTTPQGQAFLWVGSLSGDSAGYSGKFTVVNTGSGADSTTVRVTCTWTRKGGGGGKGKKKDDEQIAGEAIGTATRTSTQVAWQFDRVAQVADGTSPIKWTVGVYDSSGTPVNVTFNGVTGVNQDPTTANWTVEEDPKQSYNLSGSVKTSNGSTGKLQVSYTGADGSPNTTETTLVFVKFEVKKVTFTSDQGVLTDYNNDFAGTGGDVYNPRGWIKGGANNPITHEKGSKVSLVVTVLIKPSGISLNLLGNSKNPALQFNKNGVVSTGEDQEISIDSNEKLPLKMDVLNILINWSVTVGGVPCGKESSGEHKVYVVWGNLGDGPTLKRVNWVVTSAKNARDNDEVASKIADKLDTVLVDKNGNSNAGTVWSRLDNPLGTPDGNGNLRGYDCLQQAEVASAALNLVGIPSGTDKAYPTGSCAEGSDGLDRRVTTDIETKQINGRNCFLSYLTGNYPNKYEGYFWYQKLSAGGQAERGICSVFPRKNIRTGEWKPLQLLWSVHPIGMLVWAFDNPDGTRGYFEAPIVLLPATNDATPCP